MRLSLNNLDVGTKYLHFLRSLISHATCNLDHRYSGEYGYLVSVVRNTWSLSYSPTPMVMVTKKCPRQYVGGDSKGQGTGRAKGSRGKGRLGRLRAVHSGPAANDQVADGLDQLAEWLEEPHPEIVSAQDLLNSLGGGAPPCVSSRHREASQPDSQSGLLSFQMRSWSSFLPWRHPP